MSAHVVSDRAAVGGARMHSAVSDLLEVGSDSTSPAVGSGAAPVPGTVTALAGLAIARKASPAG